MTAKDRCFYCYQTIGEDAGDFHPACARKIFGTTEPPELPFDLAATTAGGKKLVLGRIALTGVQPKLSLEIEKVSTGSTHRRFTIVGAAGAWGDYILKPPSSRYEALPENEDLSMHLAEIAGIRTAKHTLMRLHSGELAYITKRFDRVGTARSHVKLAMEDMCQLTGRMSEEKYRGSYEQIGKIIAKFTSNPGLDAIEFYKRCLFCYLIGNSDMHLKNFSLLTKDGLTELSPAYDLLSTVLVLNDEDETGLTMNGKMRRLKATDWKALAENLGVRGRPLDRVHAELIRALPKMLEFVEKSFLRQELQAGLSALIEARAATVFKTASVS